MKKLKTEAYQPMKNHSPALKHGCLLGALAAAALPLAHSTARADDAPPPSRVDALLNFEFSNEYLTPRGMVVQDRGLTFQQLALGFGNLYKGDKDAFLNDVTLVGGVWGDFATRGVSVHPPFGSKPTTGFVEIDPIAGLSFTFWNHFTLSETYTAFVMQILDIGTSQHLDSKLAFDDSDYLKAFALHPYFEYWQELENKATAADVPYLVNPLGLVGKGTGPGSSYYFELGIAPSYTFTSTDPQLEAPCRILLPDSRFYGAYYSSSSTVGLYEVGLKATLPLKNFAIGYGHWSVHAGVRLMEFVDKNLQDMNAFNAPGKATSHEWQGYAGLSIFF